MMKYKHRKSSQALIVIILVILTALLSLWMWFSPSNNIANNETQYDQINGKSDNESKAEQHADESAITLTSQEMIEQGLEVDVASMGLVEQLTTLPGKLVVNTDQQAHVSPNFSGYVEKVNVALGQTVQKGQTLAVLTVPELIDQQSNLKIAQANLDLARQDYQREHKLWSQGISAKQDYQRAENTYRQAQITVQTSRARLKALGASGSQNGSFPIKAPISGVISQKDIVIGENVQLADQLFVIEQLKDLWLEFTLSNQVLGQLRSGQKIQFKVNGSDAIYSATIQSLTSQAEVQTGRLVVRAKLDEQAEELRPNVMVNVLISEGKAQQALRIKKAALQTIEREDSIFIVEFVEKGQLHLKAQKVQLGQASSDGEWLEIISGLNEGQKYISKGGFLLKSELEKGEADHAH